ncbi:MAG: Hsp70 family protein [Deltaproteobacteria bacterium]|nr:Hsp70 family protein [Deltaproteobacteria bacterium]
MRLGIDFGTTRTVVAVCDRGNYPVLSFHAEGGDAIDGFPSVVAATSGATSHELRFGLDALAVAEDPDWHLLRSFKRVLGEPGGPDRLIEIGGVRVRVHTLLVGFLEALREAIYERSNLPKAKKKDKELRAVVATPAHAHGTQRFLTLDAFRRAGFEVVATLNEPSAAGFEYTHAHGGTVTSRREHVVVYDLGGGTFDASLVRVTDLKHDAVITAGDARLGGDDFDEVLVELVLKQARLAPDARERARLLDQCRDAKERLNPNSKRVGIDLGERTVWVTTADYYAACAPLVERTIEAMLPVMHRAQESERSESDTLAEIAGIYVVGGASALPIVGRMLRERFGRRVHRSAYPAAATAVGLAIAADEESGFELTDRFSRTFGVFREASAGSDVAFDVIFDRETALPARDQTVVQERRYRVAHDLGHFRFVECSGVDRAGAPEGDLSLFADVRFPFVEGLQRLLERENVDLAAHRVQRLPALGDTIRERYELDAHGLVRLSLKDEQTGFERAFDLRR